jgi:lysophospholipase L1-like esterase
MPSHSRTGTRSWREGLLLFAALIACALLLGLTELGYRFFKTGSFGLSPVRFIPDPVLVYRLNPALPQFRTGFRGEGLPADRTGGTLVICLGGSTTLGHGVPVDSAWPRLTRDSLRGAGERSWVLNAGVNGYGSRQLLRRFQTETAAMDPDYVVVYEGWNRVGRLVNPDAFSPFRKGFMGHVVTSLTPFSLLVRDVARPFAQRALARVGKWRPDRFQSVWETDMDSLVAQIADHGIRPVVVVYPSLYHAGMTAADLEAYRGKGWLGRSYDPGMVAEIQEKHNALRRIAAARGAVIVDVQAALEPVHGQPRRALFLDEWHLSPAGHHVVARLVAAALLEDLAAREHVTAESAVAGQPGSLGDGH